MKYGRLTFVRLAPRSSMKHPRWEMLCDCGRTTVVYKHGAVSGKTASCGCLYRETRGKRTRVRSDKGVPRLPPPERLEDLYVPEPNSGCFLWTGTLDKAGYGRAWNGRKKTLAHRFSYELAKGPIPEGLHIDHLCRVTACVNPDHLEAVTQAENNARAYRALGILPKEERP